MEIIINLIKWMFFSVGIALVPMVASFLMQVDGSAPIRSDFFNNFFNFYAQKGDLLIVSGALVGEGVSDLFSSSTAPRLIRIFIGGVCILALILTTLLFANITAGSGTSVLLADLSIKLFVVCLLCSAACKIIGALP